MARDTKSYHILINGTPLCESGVWSVAVRREVDRDVVTCREYGALTCGQIDASPEHREQMETLIHKLMPEAMVEWKDGMCTAYDDYMSRRWDGSEDDDDAA
jgi:hypothetical protein